MYKTEDDISNKNVLHKKEAIKMNKTVTEDLIIEKIAKQLNIKKSLAKKLFINSLIYNVVRNEIVNQAQFLYENEIELI